MSPPAEQDYKLVTEDEKKRKSHYFEAIYRLCVKNLAKGKALDVGCGDGLFIDLLNRKGWIASGIDSFSKLAFQRPDVTTRDFVTLRTNERYQLISFIHSFEHLEDSGKALQRSLALLEPRGCILIVVPNFGGIWSRLLGSQWPWLNLEGHHFHYTEEAIRRILEQNGFDVIRVKTYSAFTPSILQAYLFADGVLEKKILHWRPLKSALFRVSGAMRRPANWIVDKYSDGAELHVLASPRNESTVWLA